MISYVFRSVHWIRILEGVSLSVGRYEKVVVVGFLR
jgi:hypothetical protein